MSYESIHFICLMSLHFIYLHFICHFISLYITSLYMSICLHLFVCVFIQEIKCLLTFRVLVRYLPYRKSFHFNNFEKIFVSIIWNWVMRSDFKLLRIFKFIFLQILLYFSIKFSWTSTVRKTKILLVDRTWKSFLSPYKCRMV